MNRFAILAVFAIGCGGAAAAPPPAAPPPPAPTVDPNARGADAPPPEPSSPGVIVESSTKETPVMRCGAMDSYKYVAVDFKCQDGSNPFNGNLQAAQKSRRGNVGANSHGHIIDVYVVPCPEGPREVYVDMYGCKDGAPPGPGGGKI
jgi:hypothetical protein